MFYLNIKHCRNYKIDYIINYRFYFKVGLVWNMKGLINLFFDVIALRFLGGYL